MFETFHVPVLLTEAIELLRCRPDGTYLDGTVGGGGHAEAILQRTAPGGRLIGIDVDEEALAAAVVRLAPFGARAVLRRGNFAEMDAITAGLGVEKLDGILLDLGVSSHQVKSAARGFGFTFDAPLDMRMDRRRSLKADEVVNSFPPERLERIFREYGEETMARRIAKVIARARQQVPIRTTGQLAAVVARARPTGRSGRIHPATKTFQALRIFVNDELANLHRGLAAGIELLAAGGRIAVISFHSLEDRIVKEKFRELAAPCLCPPGMPVCTCGRIPRLRLITRRAVVPTAAETAANPQARSARLRVAERI